MFSVLEDIFVEKFSQSVFFLMKVCLGEKSSN